MKIQQTNVLHRDNNLYIVELLIADDPFPEVEQKQVRLVSRVAADGGQSPHLATLQRAALDDALDVLEQQRQECVRALRQNQ